MALVNRVHLHVASWQLVSVEGPAPTTGRGDDGAPPWISGRKGGGTGQGRQGSPRARAAPPRELEIPPGGAAGTGASAVEGAVARGQESMAAVLAAWEGSDPQTFELPCRAASSPSPRREKS